MNEYVRDIFVRVLKSKPKLSLEQVQHNGDILFSVQIKDLGIDPAELAHPIFRTRFFVNFVGELLVRCNVEVFAHILTNLDSGMYDKIICGCKHTDFGMYIDTKHCVARWQMHISLIQQILTEDFDRILDEESAAKTVATGTADADDEPDIDSSGEDE
jgi:hypothetical protein